MQTPKLLLPLSVRAFPMAAAITGALSVSPVIDTVASASASHARPLFALHAMAPQQSDTRRPVRKPPAKKKTTPAKPAALRYTTPRGAAALSADLGAILGSRTRSGSWGAMVISISRG
jgi:hypothetical protein